MEIFDLLGRKIATPVGAEQDAGTKKTEVDMTQASAGTYFARLHVDRDIQTVMLKLVK